MIARYCLLSIGFAASVSLAQVPAASVEFEAASVKRAAEVSPGTGAIKSTGFREVEDAAQVRYSNVTLRWLIAHAYRIDESTITGPTWLDIEKYDIAAKLSQNASKAQIPLMLQHLLADRFKLVIRKEDKRRRAYDLVVEKKGPRLIKSDPKANTRNDPLTFSSEGIEMSGITLPRLADFLTRMLHCSVKDATGIEGEFDIRLKVSISELSGIPAAPQEGSTNDVFDQNEAVSTLVAAIRELGLNLVPHVSETTSYGVVSALRTPLEN
jgi:uncharacterized protein (TIGR03435 family)